MKSHWNGVEPVILSETYKHKRTMDTFDKRKIMIVLIGLIERNYFFNTWSFASTWYMLDQHC